MTMRAGVSALVASLLLSLLPVAEPLAAPSPPPLFDAAAPTAPTAPSAASSRATVRQRPVTSRLDLLTRPDGSPALASGDRVQLNLFDDARFTMIVTDVTRHGRYGLTWSGALDGVDLGSATLAVHDGALVGHVSMPAATYRIGYAAGRLHASNTHRGNASRG